MLGIFVDIENELADIEREVALLEEAVNLYERRLGKGERAWDWLAVQGLASAVEKAYAGCERAMAMIADEIDGAKVDRGRGWHVALLKRMARPFPEVRDAVISTQCYRTLDRLRAFRHRERYSYGLTLDPDIVVERARLVRPAFERFREELRDFAARMQKPGPDTE